MKKNKRFILRKTEGFTLMELMIMIVLITIIAILLFLLLNPLKQIAKARDSKRKKELDTLRKVFEDYYNDKLCYPKPTEVCYDPFEPISKSCHICSNQDFRPYLPELPCDPEHPVKDYLYLIDNPQCPAWYKIYTRLSDSPTMGGYNWGVSSPNINPEPYTTISPTISPTPTSVPTPTPTQTPTPTPSPSPVPCPADPVSKYCYKGHTEQACNICGIFAQCHLPGSCNEPIQLYTDNCETPCSE